MAKRTCRDDAARAGFDPTVWSGRIGHYRRATD